MTGKNDILIKNGRVWPSVDEDVIEGGSVLIRDGRIEKTGKFKARASTVIDADGCLVMPGLIQTHVHLCQTLFKGVAEDLPLLRWLRNYIWPLEAAHDPASLHTSALLSCAEMIRGGTTAMMTMETVRHTGAAFEAVDEAGMMAVISHCFMDESGGYPPLAVEIDDAVVECDLLLDKWGDHPRLCLGVAPRFALSCTAENMRYAAEYARNKNLILHTHASEQIPEIELVRERTGMANIEYLHDIGLTGPDVGIAHCVHTDPQERDLLQETGTHVLHCPSTNLKLGSGIAPIPEYLERGINVSLGADGAPGNNRLDAFVEMREAALIQKPRLEVDSLPAREVVRMATEMGARALGWEDEMGTLEPGKLANLILLDSDGFHVIPSDDPATNVVYHHHASDVQMTMVAGEILFEDGLLTTIDEDRLRETVRRERTALFDRADI